MVGKIKLKLVADHNNKAWDNLAQENVEWSVPVSEKIIKEAKEGRWEINITKKPLDNSWLPKDILGKKILCLASAGGQQAPILSAAGADVTVYDFSKEQLAKDRYVAKRDGLDLNCIQGDMRDLSALDSGVFDYIICPISNLYIPSLDELWVECYRVLNKQGVLLTSFYNPVLFIFKRDKDIEGNGLLKPEYKLPYSDLDSICPKKLEEKIQKGEVLVFGHTLTEQIGKQIAAGFLISGFYEDQHPTPRFLIEKYMDTKIATKAVKV